MIACHWVKRLSLNYFDQNEFAPFVITGFSAPPLVELL
jgi:hypothetical protein